MTCPIHMGIGKRFKPLFVFGGKLAKGRMLQLGALVSCPSCKFNRCVFSIWMLLQWKQAGWVQTRPLKAHCQHWLHPVSGKMAAKGPWQQRRRQEHSGNVHGNWSWLCVCRYMFWNRLRIQLIATRKVVIFVLVTALSMSETLTAQCHHWLHPPCGKMPGNGRWQQRNRMEDWRSLHWIGAVWIFLSQNMYNIYIVICVFIYVFRYWLMYIYILYHIYIVIFIYLYIYIYAFMYLFVYVFIY